jgi:hypothetical protein
VYLNPSDELTISFSSFWASMASSLCYTPPSSASSKRPCPSPWALCGHTDDADSAQRVQTAMPPLDSTSR